MQSMPLAVPKVQKRSKVENFSKTEKHLYLTS